MAMGFNSTEARLALRASFNNVDEAIEQIIKVCFFSILNQQKPVLIGTNFGIEIFK